MTTRNDRYVLGDWGTTRARLSLYVNDVVVERREGPGIGSGTPPADTLARLVTDWANSAQPLEVLLCGMAGSRTGLFEVPYATVPTDRAAWCRAVVRRRISGVDVSIAAGLQYTTEDGAADVMRGEETQIFGALRLHPSLAEGSHLFVLPGTHNKWAEVRNGVVQRFRTAITGELFALLRDHSMLFKAANAVNDATSDMDAGFLAGAQRSTKLAQGLLASLFETRTAQLIGQRSTAWAKGFLSGLLIGYEVASFSESYGGADVTIIGDPQLASLYGRVLASRDIAARVLDGDACSTAGLRELRDSLPR